VATAWRYVTETVRLLAARAPKLGPALEAAKKAGHAFVVIDGTLIAIDRMAKDRPFSSGKHHKHGGASGRDRGTGVHPQPRAASATVPLAA
jgi:hypothetical protein